MDTTRNDDLPWRKPSTCPSGGTCVEIAALPGGGAAIRDGKDPEGPALRFDTAEWTLFIAAAKAGEYDPSSPIPAQSK
jgi:hypothetical protein